MREQEAALGLNADPRILIEIEDIEEELEQLRTEATEASGRSPRKKISPNELNKARRRYLTILEEDVNNRLQTSTNF